MIQGLLVLNYPDTYTPKGYHGTLLLFAITALAVFFNTWLASHLPKVEGAILIIHVLGYFAILIPMTYLAPHSSAKEVFGDFINGGGFNGMGLSFFVGIITTIFAFLGKLTPRPRRSTLRAPTFLKVPMEPFICVKKSRTPPPLSLGVSCLASSSTAPWGSLCSLQYSSALVTSTPPNRLRVSPSSKSSRRLPTQFKEQQQ